MEVVDASGVAKGKDTKMTNQYSLYLEAYRRYTERFTHTVMEMVEHTSASGISARYLTPVTYRPESVCNHQELDTILKSFHDWEHILFAMRGLVGTNGPKKDTSGHFEAMAPSRPPEDDEPVVTQLPCVIAPNERFEGIIHNRTIWFTK